MSISRFQERFLSGGCAKLFLGVMAAVFVGGLIWIGAGSRGSSPNDGENPQKKTIATIGNVELPLDAVNTAFQRQTEQAMQSRQGAPLGPMELASMESGTLTQMVDQSTAMYLARQQGADFSDESVRKALSDLLDQQMEMQKFQIMMSGQLKPNATDKDFEAFVKQRTGKTVAELKADSMKQIDEALKDPEKKPLLEADAAQGILLNSLKQKNAPTDDELKQNYTNYETKRILFKDSGAKKGAEQAAAVLADLKANKLTFEQAVDRYSKDTPQKGKKLSENTIPVSGALIDSTDQYKALKGLKVGDVSAVVDTPEGSVIYKIVKATSGLPTDFDKNKQKYSDQVATQRSQSQLQKMLEDAKKSVLVKFSDPGFEVLYAYGRALSDPANQDPKKRTETLRSVYDQAKKAVETGGSGQREAVLTEFAAFDAIYSAPGADKAKLADERIQVLETFLQNSESQDLRLELVDLYTAKKDAARAGDHLLMAAQNNNDYDANGQRIYGDIAAKFSKVKAKKLLTKDQEASIQKELDRWRKEKADYEKQKAADEAQRKKDEAEMRKQEAEFRKEQQKAQQNKPPTTSSKPVAPLLGGTKP